MGNSHIRDPNIQIFMQVNKQYYFAGEYVQGEVYLRVKQPSQYTKLLVGVDGEEFVYWTEGQGRNRRYYTNRIQNYKSYFIVMDFQGKVGQGDYTFPFSFLLPNMITGSFFYSKHCFLKYNVQATLEHPSQTRKNQFYTMFLNILEPPRMMLGPVSTTCRENSKCCNCCKSYGITSVTLNCSNNFAMNGDLLQINGVIDNSQGKQIITQSKIMFERRRFMVAKNGRVHDTVQQSFELQRIGSIAAHDTRNFNFTGKIPQNLYICTAIGKITAMYYLIHLYTDYGCCANKAQAKLHIIFHSKSPMIIRPQLLPQPPNWYPQIFQKVVFQSMLPYIYQPHLKMPFVNLQQTQMMLNQNINSANRMNQMNNNNNMQISSQNMVVNENWGNKHTYKPVFYNQQAINDAHRSYLQENSDNPYYTNNSDQSQNQIYKKL